MANEKFRVKYGLAVGDNTTETAMSVDGTTGDITTTGDINVNGGDIKTTASSASLFNDATATTVSMAGSATTVSIGANTGTTTVNNSLVADDISILTVDATNIEVTNIKAKDGTAAATIANSTGAITVSSSLQVNNIDIRLNTISATDPNGSINLTPNGTGSVRANGSLDVGTIRALDGTTAITIANSTGAVTLANDLAVNGGDITTTQTTASVFNTTATTLNIGGAATTTNIGATTSSSIINGVNRYSSPIIYSFAGANNYRGLMISNGNTGSAAAARTGVVLRTFPTATQPRGGLIFENARGTETSPTALQGPTTTAVPDFLGEISAGGRTSTGWINDVVAASPLGFTSYAAENWVAATNVGTGWALQLQPTATTLTAGGASRITTIDSTPQGLTLRGDTHGFSKGKTIQFTATGCSTSGTTLTIGTVTSGTVAVGSMIQNSTSLLPAGTYIVANISGSGSGSTWTLNQSVSTYTSVLTIAGQQGYVAYTGAGDVDIIGDLTLRGNDIKNSAGTTVITTNTTNVAFAVPVDFPVYTVAQATAITGAVGWQICISNSSTSPTQTEDGLMAYWGTTATAGWKYIHDNRAI